MTTEKLSPAQAARALMHKTAAGFLATQSVAVPGYSLGSVVPFVLTPEGQCIVYISRIAQHTKNFAADPRASLTATDADLSGASGDPQASGRVSVLGDAHLLAGDEEVAARTRYESFFPESRGHAAVHDFEYWKIEPVRVRYIGGFGAIHWIEPDAFCLARAEWQDGEAGIVKHMNEDHTDAMALMWTKHEEDAGSERVLGDAAAEEPTMVASNPEGFHMRRGDHVLYIPYAKTCETAMDVRKEMVRLTKEAREAASDSP